MKTIALLFLIALVAGCTSTPSAGWYSFWPNSWQSEAVK